MNLVEALSAASDKRKQVMEEAANAVKAVLAPGLQLFLQEHPEIEALKWAQYTPYFNDGEPCEFSVGDLYYKPTGGADDSGDYGDGFEYLSSYGKPEGFMSQQWVKDLGDLAAALQKAEDELLAAFGDHVKVIVTREGVDVEEYEHD
jgi:hypothetical protein